LHAQGTWWRVYRANYTVKVVLTRMSRDEEPTAAVKVPLTTCQLWDVTSQMDSSRDVRGMVTMAEAPASSDT
jgi:hypothetical protein